MLGPYTRKMSYYSKCFFSSKNDDRENGDNLPIVVLFLSHFIKIVIRMCKSKCFHVMFDRYVIIRRLYLIFNEYIQLYLIF